MPATALKLGIIGSTLSHSRSPQIQNAGLAYLGIEGEYSKYEIDQENFNQDIAKLLASGVNGINVTFPYKEAVLKFLNYRDPLVERIGATNTLLVKDSKILGFNTDYFGFMQSVNDLDLEGKTVSLLGAGGAARSIIIALEDLGVSQINVHARNLQKVEGTLPRVTKTKLNLLLFNAETDLRDSSLIINSTPIGQGRLANSMPISNEQMDLLKSDSIIYDLIYEDTMLLQESRGRGLKTINGTDMLVLQGVQSLSLWTGREIEDGLVNAMKSAF